MQLSILAARFSGDRSALESLLRVEDLPDGWFQQKEWRWRVGFLAKNERARRARQAKLVGATRQFELVGTGTWVAVWAIPVASVEDAQYNLEHAWESPSSLDPHAVAQAYAEVSPPVAAGEHARAALFNTTYESGPRWTRFDVLWHEGQPLVFQINLTAPTEYNLLDAMSMLIELQRGLSASAST